ncbi:MAG: EAL domain-containing protein [Sphaerochaeta sp.]|jgi:PAS domain S-box-containing protein|nr:EAL domain-containing protein [Sphaerochaeta sp.]MDX9914670.1 EAL domain-containing protein [Sphaerochaeta sp.]
MRQLLIHGLEAESIQLIQSLLGDSLTVRSVERQELEAAFAGDDPLALAQEEEAIASSIRERAERFDAIFGQAPIGITISHGLSPGNTVIDEILTVNPRFEEIVGYSKEQLLRLGWSGITHPEDLEREREPFRRLLAGEIGSYTLEKRYVRPDGSTVWAEIVVAPINVGGDDFYNHICLVQDISERKMIERSLKESERSKGVLLSHLPGMAYRCKNDADWTMLYISPGCERLTGYTVESLLNNRELSFNEIVAPSHTAQVHREWQEAIAGGRSYSGEYEIITKDGERKWVWELGQGIVNEDGKVEELEGLILSINYRKHVEAELRYHSQHDLATGLYNRRYLEELLKNQGTGRGREQAALVAVNLSNLHSSAMTYGFLYSQEILKNVAQQLTMLCKPSYTLSVIHEYQFVFFIQGYAGKGELKSLANTISEELSTFLAMEGIGWGIGILEIGQRGGDAQDLIRKLLVVSEQALQRWGSNSPYLFFDEQMETQLYREEQITSELSAIASGEGNGRLYLLYQPIITIADGAVAGFEALVRLDIPTLGTISPLEFIPMAEKTKLIIPLGESIIIEALRFLDTLNKQGYDNLTVSINISALQLLKQGFSPNILRTIRAMGVDAENICLEITESIFATNYQEINRILKPLRNAGIKIAIDDFGTGYSSLARERELEVDYLKIDKFFVDKLARISEGHSITSDIISMAHKLGHCTIAEGVEEERQLHYLKKYGCDMLQGYLFAKPLSEEHALGFLASHSHSEVEQLLGDGEV